MRNESGQFVKGHSGNPAGRPARGQAFPDIVWNELEKPHAGEKSNAAAVMEKLISRALNDDSLQALKIITDLMLNTYKISELQSLNDRITALEKGGE